MPGFADGVAEGEVVEAGGVPGDGVELADVDFAVGEDAGVGRGVDNLANDEGASVLALAHLYHAALHGDGVLVDDWGVDVGALGGGEACADHFVGHIVAADDAEVVALDDGAGVGIAEGEGAVEAQVVGGAVFGEHEAYAVALALSAPGGHHDVGGAVGVVGADHEGGLGGDVEFGAHIGAPFDRFEFHRLVVVRGFDFGVAVLFVAAGCDEERGGGEGEEGLFHCCIVCFILPL